MFPLVRSGMVSVHPLRRALHALTRRAPVRPRPVVVQPLGFEGRELETLGGVLDEVGRELGLQLQLDDVSGDVVLAEKGFIDTLAPQVLQAFLDERPLLALEAPTIATAQARQRIRSLHASLLRELQQGPRAAPASALDADHEPATGARRAERGGDSGYDSAFDSRPAAGAASGQEPDADSAELLNRLRRGLVDPGERPLVAAHADDAVLSFDFAQGSVLLDERADQRLRVMRELPRLAPHARPGARVKRRDLDLVAWDLALAAHHLRLLHAPANWWHTPLLALPQLDITRYSRQPQHLALARELACAPVSPSALRRRCRVSVDSLRGFLQAMLVLGLAQWLEGDWT